MQQDKFRLQACRCYSEHVHFYNSKTAGNSGAAETKYWQLAKMADLRHCRCFTAGVGSYAAAAASRQGQHGGKATPLIRPRPHVHAHIQRTSCFSGFLVECYRPGTGSQFLPSAHGLTSAFWTAAPASSLKSLWVAQVDMQPTSPHTAL